MTCVVGMIKKNGDIIVAADTEGSNGWEKTKLSTPKVFIKNDIAFGFCGTIRLIQCPGCGDEDSFAMYDNSLVCWTCECKSKTEREIKKKEELLAKKKYDFKKRSPFYFDVDDTILTENGEGPPYPHAKEVIEGLIKIGYEVNIWSARGKEWAKHITENILKIEGVNAYLTKPNPKKTFDDKPDRIASRLVGVKSLLSDDDWYSLGMKFLKWKKNEKK